MRHGARSGQAAGLPRRRPRRRQDLRDARRGPAAAPNGARTSWSASSRPTAGQDTARLLDGLEVVPRAEVDLPRLRPREMDLAAILARHPRWPWSTSWPTPTCPGSRHEKRWQDVEELLAPGIDVITTVNIQHLESLNDVVEPITGVRQRETVPDEVVRAADPIELVDMSPQALRRRMAHGNVYAADKVDAALSQLLPGGQSRGPARARAALAGRPGRRGPGALPRAARDRRDLGHPRTGRGRGHGRAGVVDADAPGRADRLAPAPAGSGWRSTSPAATA